MHRPARETTALIAVLLAGSCAGPATVSGRAPENPTRDPSHEQGTSPRERAAAIARHASESGLREPSVSTVDPADARIGVVTTRLFHVAGCTLLAGVATADQMRFSSKWDALDTGYAPCTLCRSQN